MISPLHNVSFLHATINLHSRPSKKPLQKSVRIYKREELNLKTLAARTKAVLKQLVFPWQLEVGVAALCGEDIIVDVGTGGGKSVAFLTPRSHDRPGMRDSSGALKTR